MVHGGTLFKVHSDWCSDGKGTNQTALKLRQISNHTACVWAASLAAVHGRIKCQKKLEAKVMTLKLQYELRSLHSKKCGLAPQSPSGSNALV